MNTTRRLKAQAAAHESWARTDDITKAEIYIDRRRGGFYAPQQVRLFQHNNTTRPASPPAITAGPQSVGTIAVDDARWMTVPTAWGQAIAAATARGLGIYTAATTPYVVLASLAENGATGALRLTWQRS